MTRESSSIPGATEQEGFGVGDKPISNILECFPVSGWESAHFRGRHATLSVTASTAVLINQLE